MTVSNCVSNSKQAKAALKGNLIREIENRTNATGGKDRSLPARPRPKIGPLQEQAP